MRSYQDGAGKPSTEIRAPAADHDTDFPGLRPLNVRQKRRCRHADHGRKAVPRVIHRGFACSLPTSAGRRLLTTIRRSITARRRI